MSEKKANVYERLQAVRDEFQLLPIKKTGWNPYSKFKYFELGDFLPALIRLLSENGLVSIVTFEKDMAYLDLVIVAEPDQRIRFSSPMSSAKLTASHEVQNLGAVQTYLRRYLYVAVCELVEHDALDATLGDPKAAPVETTINDLFFAPESAEAPYSPPPTVKGGGILAEVRQLAESIGFDAPDIRDWSNHKHAMAFAKLTDEQQEIMCRELEAKVAVYKAICQLMNAEHGNVPDGLTEAEQCDRATAYIREKAAAKPFDGKPLRAPFEKWKEWAAELETSFFKEQPK